MSDHPSIQHIQNISQQIAFLQNCMADLPLQQQEQIRGILETMVTAVSNLQLSYEEMLSILEASEIVEEKLLTQHQQTVTAYQHYYNLFQCSPIASCVTDANGLIIEANPTFCQLLNISPCYLMGKPLAVYIAPAQRPHFRTLLNRLVQMSRVQTCEIELYPRKKDPFIAQLKTMVVRNELDKVEALWISVHDISHYKQTVTPNLSTFSTVPQLPHALDGLQVLVVDDEADAREFITAVLESQGINVTTADSTVEALDLLEHFRPDVLVSDIRMPDQDGYSLIKKVRELEAEKGWHIPAAALTSYLVEDREKARSAGFESHLHKLAQPSELVDLIARLAGRKSPD
ncbi:PAS sensor protein [Aphanothece hegewaldii CCALA 016]|uniref:PAS sensor protein n=1 Tax=Aphanothece hegewaldii CCALA 016 TaxID=2107694 RepID=A0A2T1LUY5_9CHRO|nr:response regulator [Aphanothece hegewaldii]PSF35438.1 PAS sensor protein [Aphanothece hegewaldii CCALA 016]